MAGTLRLLCSALLVGAVLTSAAPNPLSQPPTGVSRDATQGSETVCVVCVVIVALVAAFFLFDLGQYASLAHLKSVHADVMAQVHEHPIRSSLIYFVGYILVTGLSLPDAAVMTVALLMLVIPPLALGAEWSVWLYRSLVLLVIACPCALVISTPVSVVAALAAAARNGVLIKGGVFIELPAQLKAIAMDKTGTLTQGAPAVVDVVPMNGHDEHELLMRAGALELNSNHPLARAIVEEARNRELQLAPADEFETIQGKGAFGVIDGKPFWLDSHRYLEKRGQETPEVHEQLEAMQERPDCRGGRE